jgi:zinc transport system substrate-binding protein
MNGKLVFFITITFFFVSNINAIHCENIITSVKPVALFLKNITAENDNVINIIPANANPHTFEPTPSLVRKLKEADIFIGVEKGFDSWIERFLPENCIVFYLIKGNGKNPHIWLSPLFMKKKLSQMTKTLCMATPQNCPLYQHNAENFANKLVKFIQKMKEKLKLLKNISFFQFHPAWDYFATDFQINIVGTISKHGISVSPKKYFHLIKIAKDKHVKYILTGINGKNNLLKGFSKQIDAKILQLDSLGSDTENYFDFIGKNIEKIITGVKGYNN